MSGKRTITFEVAEDLADQLAEIARVQTVSVSALVRQAVAAFLEARKQEQ